MSLFDVNQASKGSNGKEHLGYRGSTFLIDTRRQNGPGVAVASKCRVTLMKCSQRPRPLNSGLTQGRPPAFCSWRPCPRRRRPVWPWPIRREKHGCSSRPCIPRGQAMYQRFQTAWPAGMAKETPQNPISRRKTEHNRPIPGWILLVLRKTARAPPPRTFAIHACMHAVGATIGELTRLTTNIANRPTRIDGQRLALAPHRLLRAPATRSRPSTPPVAARMTGSPKNREG